MAGSVAQLRQLLNRETLARKLAGLYNNWWIQRDEEAAEDNQGNGRPCWTRQGLRPQCGGAGDDDTNACGGTAGAGDD